jgi:peptidyl-tRNA hydrolase, PTH1 family
MQKFLIVGLGNPGTQYVSTRHNIGFETLDVLAWQQKAAWKEDRHAAIATFKLKGKTIILVKPNTFMNLSGKAVKYWMDKEKIELENILIVVDDLALPIEKLRLKLEGSDGGHNGLKDIQLQLATTKYAKLRFGVGSNFPKGMQAEFVLSKWKKEEIPLVEQKIIASITTIEKFVLEGTTNAMLFCNSFVTK